MVSSVPGGPAKPRGPGPCPPATASYARRVDRYQYLMLMGACFALTLPLEFAFRARVYRRPGRLLRALGPPVIVFSLWDMVAIARDHWTFNRRYVTGWQIPLHLPVEEIAFFVIIPICALLTFEASRRVLGR